MIFFLKVSRIFIIKKQIKIERKNVLSIFVILNIICIYYLHIY